MAVEDRRSNTDLKWNHRAIAEEGGLVPKPLTNVRTGWISPTEEREHLNIEKLQHVPALICYNAHSLLSKMDI